MSHVVQNSGDRLRITANRWAGRVECVGRGYVVAIADGFEPNDLLAGYRAFSTNNIVTLGDEFFVTEPRRLATPCTPTAGARERV
jgi:hypothetical protein